MELEKGRFLGHNYVVCTGYCPQGGGPQESLDGMEEGSKAVQAVSTGIIGNGVVGRELHQRFVGSKVYDTMPASALRRLVQSE
jgi:hypothetical protein